MKTLKFGSIGSSPMMHSLCRALESLGFETKIFPTGSPVVQPNQNPYDLMYNGIREHGADCDWIILCGACHNHFRAVPDACKQLGKKLLYWMTEDPIHYNDNEYIMKNADIILSPAIECVEKYRKMGKTAYLFMFATDPFYHKVGNYNSRYDCDLMAQFSYYDWENRLMGYKIVLDSAKKLVDNGHSMQLWGAFWDSTGKKTLGDNYSHLFKGYMNNGDLPDVCVSSKIILGVQCDGQSQTQQSMRAFEILGCGGFHLCQWTQSMDYWFENGRHLVAVKTQEEAIERMEFYLKNESCRNEVARQGFQYVQQNHTYRQRIEQSFLKDVI